MTTTLNNPTPPTTESQTVEEPEDIFAATESMATPQPIPPINTPVSPISEPLSSEYHPEVLTPEASVSEFQSNQETAPKVARRRPLNWRIIIIIGVVLAVSGLLAGIVWGGYYWYTHRNVDGDVVVNVNEDTNINADLIVNVNIPVTPVNTSTPQTDTNTSQLPDSDHDGLSDEEEKVVNTNPLKKDTDEDGLSDREEVRVYLTDPRNADTDGDGYGDGQEVANFYHPNHPDPKKRLFDLPQQ